MVRGVDRAIPDRPARRQAGAVVHASGRCARTRYDAVFDVQGLIKSAVLARLVGARRTFGLPRRAPARTGRPRCSTPTRRTWAARRTSSTRPGAGRRTLAQLRPRRRFPLEMPPSAPARAGGRSVIAGGFALLNPGARVAQQAVARRTVRRAGGGAFASARPAIAGALGAGRGGAGRSTSSPRRGRRRRWRRRRRITDSSRWRRRRAWWCRATPGRCTSRAPSARRWSRSSVRRCAERNGPWSPDDVVVARTDAVRVPLPAAVPARDARASTTSACDEVVAAVDRLRLRACLSGPARGRGLRAFLARRRVALGFAGGAGRRSIAGAADMARSWRSGLWSRASAKRFASGRPGTSRRAAR